MNKLFYVFFAVILASGLIFGCTGIGVPTPTASTTYDSGYNSDDYDSYESDDEYDYDKGYGYTEPEEPEEGESFSDYVKRQDPELYESLQNRYDAVTDDYSEKG